MLNLQLSRQLPIQRPALARAADHYRFKPIVECARLACGLVSVITTTVGFFFASINLFKNKENRAFSVRRWRLLNVHAQQESKYAIRTLMPFLLGKVDNKDIASEWAISKAIVAADLKEFSSRNIVLLKAADAPSLQRQQQLFAKHLYVGSESPLVFAQKANLDTIAELLRSSGITDRVQMTSLKPDNRSEEADLARFQQACQKSPDTDPLLIAFAEVYTSIAEKIVKARGDKGMRAFITSHKQQLIEQSNETPYKLAYLHQIATATKCEPLLAFVQTQFRDACIHDKRTVVNTLVNQGFLLGQENYLWYACHAGNLDIVRELIGCNAWRTTPPSESPHIYDLGIQYARAETPAKKEAYLAILKLLLASNPTLITEPPSSGQKTPLAYFMLQDGWKADEKIAHKELYPVIELLIEVGKRQGENHLGLDCTVGSGKNTRIGRLIDLITEEERTALVQQLPVYLLYSLDCKSHPCIMQHLCQEQSRNKLAMILNPSAPQYKFSSAQDIFRAALNIARKNRDAALMAFLVPLQRNEEGHYAGDEARNQEAFLTALRQNPQTDPLMVALEHSCPVLVSEIFHGMSEEERATNMISPSDQFTIAGIENPLLQPLLLNDLLNHPEKMGRILPELRRLDEARFKRTVGSIVGRIEQSSPINAPAMRALLDVLLPAPAEGTEDPHSQAKEVFVAMLSGDEREPILATAYELGLSSIASALLDNVNDEKQSELLGTLDISHHYSLLSTAPTSERIINYLVQSNKVIPLFAHHQSARQGIDSNTIKNIWCRMFGHAVSSRNEALIINLLSCSCEPIPAPHQPSEVEKRTFAQQLLANPTLSPAVIAIRTNRPSILLKLLSNSTAEEQQAYYAALSTEFQTMQGTALLTAATLSAVLPIALCHGSTEFIDMIIRTLFSSGHLREVREALEQGSTNPDRRIATPALLAIYRHRMTALMPGIFARAYMNGQVPDLITTFRDVVPPPSSAAAQPSSSTIQHSGQAASSSGASAPARAAQLSDGGPAPGPSAAPAATEVPHLSCLGIDATDREMERLMAILQKHRATVPASQLGAHLPERFLKPLLFVWNSHNLLKPTERTVQIEALLTRLDAMTSAQLTRFLDAYNPMSLNQEVLKCPFLISDGRICVQKDFLSKSPEIAFLGIAESQHAISCTVKFLLPNFSNTPGSDAGGLTREFITALLDGALSGSAERIIQRKKVNILIEDQSQSVTIPEYILPKGRIEVPALTPEQERALTPAEQSARKQLKAKAKKALGDDQICIDLKHQDALYRALGDLFVQCYNTTEGMKTGDFFDRSYFHLVQQLYAGGMDPNIFANESAISNQDKRTLLRTYLYTIIEAQRGRFESQIAVVRDQLRGAPAQLIEKQRELAAKAAEIEQAAEAAREVLQEQRASIEAEIEALQQLINDGGDAKIEELSRVIGPTDNVLMSQWDSYKNKIRAALLVAQGMRRRFKAGPRQAEANFLAGTPSAITEAIQGPPWNFQTFKNNFADHITARGATPAELDIGKALFTRWLNEHSEKDAQKLCCTITGSKTNDRGLSVVYRSEFRTVRGTAERLEIPTSEVHTCGRLMYMPKLFLGNYADEEERYRLFAGEIDRTIRFAMSDGSYNDS